MRACSVALGAGCVCKQARTSTPSASSSASLSLPLWPSSSLISACSAIAHRLGICTDFNSLTHGMLKLASARHAMHVLLREQGRPRTYANITGVSKRPMYPTHCVACNASKAHASTALHLVPSAMPSRTARLVFNQLAVPPAAPGLVAQQAPRLCERSRARRRLARLIFLLLLVTAGRAGHGDLVSA